MLNGDVVVGYKSEGEGRVPPDMECGFKITTIHVDTPAKAVILRRKGRVEACGAGLPWSNVSGKFPIHVGRCIWPAVGII
jgi:hypothetical protein